MTEFWHKPDKWIDERRRWHAYNEKSQSLCGDFFVARRPPDATLTPPKKTRCHACAFASTKGHS